VIVVPHRACKKTGRRGRRDCGKRNSMTYCSPFLPPLPKPKCLAPCSPPGRPPGCPSPQSTNPLLSIPVIYSHSKHTVIVQLRTTMNSKGKRALCHCSAPSLYSPSRRPGSRPHPAPPRLHVRLRSQIDTAFKLRHELLLSARFSTLARARTSPEKARGIKSKAPLLL